MKPFQEILRCRSLSTSLKYFPVFCTRKSARWPHAEISWNKENELHFTTKSIPSFASTNLRSFKIPTTISISIHAYQPSAQNGYHTPKIPLHPTLSTLSSISLSCGLFAFFTQFLLHSSCTPSLSRLHTLLTLSSLIFLSNILTYLLLTLLLHPLHSHDPVVSWRQRLVRAGIALLYIFTFVGFILFAIAIAVAYSGPKAVGIVRVTIFTVTVSGLVIFGVSTRGPPSSPSLPEQALQDENEKQIKDIGVPKVVTLLIIFLIQLICLGLLPGVGGYAVVTGQLGSECKGVEEEVFNSGNPMPVEVVGVAAGAIVSVTREYTATVTVTEMMSSAASSDGGVATVVDLTSITVLTTVAAGIW
jgi:hypothetical protein